MKISSIIILALFLAFIIWRVAAFLIERQRQKKADREGVVVYATFVSSEPIKFFGRPQTDVEKITLRVQEPGSTEAREVVIKSRTQPGQRMSRGHARACRPRPEEPEARLPSFRRGRQARASLRARALSAA